MTPHSHITPIHLLAAVCAVFIVFGTAHLLAITKPDSRPARALIALGF